MERVRMRGECTKPVAGLSISAAPGTDASLISVQMPASAKRVETRERLPATGMRSRVRATRLIAHMIGITNLKNRP